MHASHGAAPGLRQIGQWRGKNTPSTVELAYRQPGSGRTARMTQSAPGRTTVFRLVSLLIVLLILGLMSAAAMGAFSSGEDCPAGMTRTPTSVDVSVPRELGGAQPPCS